MLGCFDDLKGRIVAHLHRRIRRKWQLRKAPSARVGVVRGSKELDTFHNHIGHVGWDSAEAHVDIDESGAVAGKPARLEGEGAAGDGPFRAVC